VQWDHVHLIVEAVDVRVLSRGVQGLAIRIAKSVNRTLHRHGRVWGERFNRKGCAGERGLDTCSSAPWFDGWRNAVATLADRSPVVRARTWLAAVGWKRFGLIDRDESPAPYQRR